MYLWTCTPELGFLRRSKENYRSPRVPQLQATVSHTTVVLAAAASSFFPCKYVCGRMPAPPEPQLQTAVDCHADAGN